MVPLQVLFISIIINMYMGNLKPTFKGNLDTLQPPIEWYLVPTN